MSANLGGACWLVSITERVKTFFFSPTARKREGGEGGVGESRGGIPHAFFSRTPPRQPSQPTPAHSPGSPQNNFPEQRKIVLRDKAPSLWGPGPQGSGGPGPKPKLPNVLHNADLAFCADSFPTPQLKTAKLLSTGSLAWTTLVASCCADWSRAPLRFLRLPWGPNPNNVGSVKLSGFAEVLLRQLVLCRQSG